MLEAIDVASLCRELDVGWTEERLRALEAELAPYSRALDEHVASGARIASHIEGSGSICVPITDVTDPQRLFTEAEGSVRNEPFEVEEHARYWVTVHHSTLPVVLLLLKDTHPVPALQELCDDCGAAVGFAVGGNRYLQFNLPGFSWHLHRDDEYEGVSSRVHVPLVTNPANLFAWATRHDQPRSEWPLVRHLERGKVYLARTDVLHTTLNEHPTQSRLHLILDVETPPHP